MDPKTKDKYRYWLGHTYHALDGHTKGLTVRQVAHRLNISEQVAKHLLGILESTGDITVVSRTPNTRWANGEPRPKKVRSSRTNPPTT